MVGLADAVLVADALPVPVDVAVLLTVIERGRHVTQFKRAFTRAACATPLGRSVTVTLM